MQIQCPQYRRLEAECKIAHERLDDSEKGGHELVRDLVKTPPMFLFAQCQPIHAVWEMRSGVGREAECLGLLRDGVVVEEEVYLSRGRGP